jgi:hypothetical protein
MNIKCKYCNIDHDLDITEWQVARHNNGELAQNVYPNLNREERELLISGTCGNCWDKMFSPPN